MPNRLIVERTTRIESPVEDVWQWHTRPGAFERLTPPWENVRLLERTGGIENGARVVLEVKVGPVPLRWVAVHRDVVDRQPVRRRPGVGSLRELVRTSMR